MKLFFFKRLFLFFLFGVALYASGRAYYHLTDDFHPGSISYDFPFRPEWEPAPLTEQEQVTLAPILSQSFAYIGKGAQCFAFVSADGKYVLKFFKFKHLKPLWFIHWLPDLPYLKEWRTQEIARKQEKFDSIFSSYKLAYDVHREGSGLLFIHLNNTDHLKKTVSVTDKMGLSWDIDLDSVLFVVQEKVRTTRQVVSKLLDKGNIDQAKKVLHKIFDLYMVEYSKGIYDRDHGVMHNTGFAGERAVHLDVGKLSSEPAMRYPDTYQLDLVKVAQRMDRWLSHAYPLYHPTLKSAIEERLSLIYGKPFSLADYPPLVLKGHE